MSKKLRLKEMSHKKLRKLCKELAKSLKTTTVDLTKSELRDSASNCKLEEARKKIDRLLERLRVNEETYVSLEQVNNQLKARTEELQLALDAMGSGPTTQLGYIGEMPDNLNMGVDGQLRSFNEMSDEEHAAWVERDVARVKGEEESYKGSGNGFIIDDEVEIRFFTSGTEVHQYQHESQAGLVTVIKYPDGKEFKSDWEYPEESEEEEIVLDHIPVKPTGVSESESQRVDMVGALFGVPQADGYIPKSADVDAAVEWAKRNGHHQPEGNPEPDKMQNVRIKSADEISRENVSNHTEMVCNEIAEDKSRLL